MDPIALLQGDRVALLSLHSLQGDRVALLLLHFM